MEEETRKPKGSLHRIGLCWIGRETHLTYKRDTTIYSQGRIRSGHKFLDTGFTNLCLYGKGHSLHRQHNLTGQGRSTPVKDCLRKVDKNTPLYLHRPAFVLLQYPQQCQTLINITLTFTDINRLSPAKGLFFTFLEKAYVFNYALR